MNIVEIKKKYFEVECYNPNNGLIKTYADFIKHRDYIKFYKFNESVFEAIIDITIKLWLTDKRVSRISLLKGLNEYRKQCLNINDVSLSIKRKLFKLFKITFLNQDKLGKSQKEDAFYKISNLIKDIELCND